MSRHAARPACRAARRRMLEADPRLLRGEAAARPGGSDARLEEGDARLEEHLRGCAGCREAAAAILETQEGLNRALEAVVASTGPTDAVVAAAARGVDRRPTEPGRRPVGSGRPGFRRATRTLLPLGAAAAAALLVLWPSGAREPTGPEVVSVPAGADDAGARAPERLARLEPVDRFALEVSVGGRAVVFATGDPGITVVWLY